jgi:DHA1 family multidrug resistance protein-like MFS transporter
MDSVELLQSKTRENAHTLKNLWQAIFWVSFPFGILTFVLPIYGKQLGASALEIGGFFSAMSVVPVIVRPILGRALDRWGRRPFLLLGLIGYLVAMIFFAAADSVLLLTIARFMQGLGTAFLWLAAYTIIADTAKESGRGHDFGVVDEAVNRGAIIGTTIGFGGIIALNYTDLSQDQIWFLLFAGFCIPTALALWLGWRGVDETMPASETAPIQGKPFSKQLLVLMGIVFITGASSAMVWPLLMVFLQDQLHAEIWALASAYLPAALLNSFLPSKAGRIADRYGRKAPMVFGLLVGALASSLMPHLHSLFALAALWSFETLGYILSLPAERAFVADIAGEDVRGTSYGLYTFAYFLGAVVGPVGGGWLYDVVGRSWPFYLNSMVLVIGAILVAAALRETRIQG